jgi:hypothetical protein
MPYKLQKQPRHDRYWVVNPITGHKFSKLPLPKEDALAQMRALYANEPKLKRGGTAKKHHFHHKYDKPPKSLSEFHPTHQFHINLAVKSSLMNIRQIGIAQRQNNAGKQVLGLSGGSNDDGGATDFVALKQFDGYAGTDFITDILHPQAQRDMFSAEGWREEFTDIGNAFVSLFALVGGLISDAIGFIAQQLNDLTGTIGGFGLGSLFTLIPFVQEVGLVATGLTITADLAQSKTPADFVNTLSAIAQQLPAVNVVDASVRILVKIGRGEEVTEEDTAALTEAVKSTGEALAEGGVQHALEKGVSTGLHSAGKGAVEAAVKESIAKRIGSAIKENLAVVDTSNLAHNNILEAEILADPNAPYYIFQSQITGNQRFVALDYQFDTSDLKLNNIIPIVLNGYGQPSGNSYLNKTGTQQASGLSDKQTIPYDNGKSWNAQPYAYRKAFFKQSFQHDDIVKEMQREDSDYQSDEALTTLKIIIDTIFGGSDFINYTIQQLANGEITPTSTRIPFEQPYNLLGQSRSLLEAWKIAYMHENGQPTDKYQPLKSSADWVLPYDYIGIFDLANIQTSQFSDLIHQLASGYIDLYTGTNNNSIQFINYLKQTNNNVQAAIDAYNTGNQQIIGNVDSLLTDKLNGVVNDAIDIILQKIADVGGDITQAQYQALLTAGQEAAQTTGNELAQPYIIEAETEQAQSTGEALSSEQITDLVTGILAEIKDDVESSIIDALLLLTPFGDDAATNVKSQLADVQSQLTDLQTQMDTLLSKSPDYKYVFKYPPSQVYDYTYSQELKDDYKKYTDLQTQLPPLQNQIAQLQTKLTNSAAASLANANEISTPTQRNDAALALKKQQYTDAFNAKAAADLAALQAEQTATNNAAYQTWLTSPAGIAAQNSVSSFNQDNLNSILTNSYTYRVNSSDTNKINLTYSTILTNYLYHSKLNGPSIIYQGNNQYLYTSKIDLSKPSKSLIDYFNAALPYYKDDFIKQLFLSNPQYVATLATQQKVVDALKAAQATQFKNGLAAITPTSPPIVTLKTIKSSLGILPPPPPPKPTRPKTKPSNATQAPPPAKTPPTPSPTQTIPSNAAPTPPTETAEPKPPPAVDQEYRDTLAQIKNLETQQDELEKAELGEKFVPTIVQLLDRDYRTPRLFVRKSSRVSRFGV